MLRAFGHPVVMCCDMAGIQNPTSEHARAQHCCTKWAKRVKPWSNEPASSRKWTQVELAQRLGSGGQTVKLASTWVQIWFRQIWAQVMIPSQVKPRLGQMCSQVVNLRPLGSPFGQCFQKGKDRLTQPGYSGYRESRSLFWNTTDS